MKTFTIENETNNITVHATTQEAEAVANAERFRNEAGLNKLAADWPAARLVEIWNSLPGVSPVKKFKDRQTAVSRIWKALQSLGQAAPESRSRRIRAGARSRDSYARCATNARRCAGRGARDEEDHAPQERAQGPKSRQIARSHSAAESSKTAQVVAMLQRKEGATLSEIMSSMGWQKHTVRGFMAGAMKKAGFTVESFKPEGGERTYRIPS